ncbi:epoxyqueuosine reductase QueH [Heliophilum fasciatum]|uniref:Epoxyqueuosine reductase QueH n=1 Tax=Heliophilum fasciatum TaxID=35700 RepID=A0A4R2RWG6_9FIRM|nr:epoxyqueuosine reductase QueH [Heliophilum fasciatum]MCW2278069.1 putative adenine nucleotide alpha hydrolase (AANH) superfamily ATPase [Heliophilum fasciatum]TCP64311.1 hypothetical protein EDD73_11010 [Heliophilum fasciatum]
MHILLHTCCAPCSIAVVDGLRQEGMTVTAYYYNPNIHPYMEFRRRKETLEAYAPTIDLPLIVEEEYELAMFLRNVAERPEERCAFCYQVRLERTAAQARSMGLDGFSTTLLVSPYQNQDQIVVIGNQVAQAYGIPFIARDFRPSFRQGQQAARELGLYRQPYCGCIYSEQERYYRPPGGKGAPAERRTPIKV